MTEGWTRNGRLKRKNEKQESLKMFPSDIIYISDT